ncbi:MAG: 6-phosphogluconolactonase [Xanthomonadaceae bacterium]|jgi:6-phosphogluconolactonase|nr:6-phosphogluconolactonase [Xanthomonadaceae bacterium]
MSPLRLHVHADAGALAEAVAAQLAEAASAGIAARGEAWLALAGGSTPLAAYRSFAAMPLDWTKVQIVASDERWVPAGHPLRNERALAEAFAAAAGVRILPLVPARADAGGFATPAALPIGSAAVSDSRLHSAEASLAPLRHRAFDAVLLGMGSDAHVASLFPRSTPPAALDPGGHEPVVAVTPDPLPPAAPVPRVSLTLSRLIASHALLLVITGEAKRGVLEAARTRPALDAPVQALLAAAPDLAIHWSP